MAEVIGLIASIEQLAQVTIKTLGYVSRVRNAPKERSLIAQEAGSLCHLLIRLQDVVEDANEKDSNGDWLYTTHSLEPLLLQLKTSLEELIHELMSGVGSKSSRIERQLAWPFKEKKCRELLNHMERVKSLILCALEENVSKLAATIRQQTKEIPLIYEKVSVLFGAREVQSRTDLLALLSPLNFFSRQEALTDVRMDGTGRWFLDSPPFQAWLKGKDDVLWCAGIPGAGKSVLASIAVSFLSERFRSDEDITVACVYFDYNDMDRQSLANVYGGLLKMILARQQDLPIDLRNIYESLIGKDLKPRASEILSILKNAVASTVRTYIAVDALDECAEQDQAVFINEMLNLGTNVSLLLTSRPLKHLEKTFTGRLWIEINAGDDDVSNYIRTRISTDGRLSKVVRGDPDFVAEIVDTVRKSAQNMFLLVKLHLDRLATQLNKRGVRQQLQILPRELDVTYDNALDRIHKQDEASRDVATKVLTWLCFAVRPLKLEEMHHAIAIEVDQESFDHEGLIADKSDLVSCCAGLVVVDAHNDEVRYVHYTTASYLRRRIDHLMPDQQVQITQACLTYLAFEDFRASDMDRENMLQDYPFVAYAARNWGRHAKGAPENHPQIQQLATSLLLKDFRVTDTYFTNPLPEDSYDPYPDKGWPLRKGPRGLHIAVGFGLQTILSKLLDDGIDPKLQDFHGESALHWAAWNGHYEIVKRLLDLGVNVNARADRNQSTPIIGAAISGHSSIVELLLDHGADIDADCAADAIGSPALHEAVWHNQPEVARLLLDRNASTSLRAAGVHTALDYAAFHGFVHLMQLLVDKGASLAGEEGISAMRNAIAGGHSASITFLAEQHVEINAVALDMAIYHGSPAVIESLLHSGTQPALPWEIGRPLIQRQVNNTWFKELEAVCVPLSPHRSRTRGRLHELRDVERKWICAEHRSYTDLPSTPLNNISGDVKQYYDGSEIDPWQALERPYLEVLVPTNFDRVDRIVFRTDSRDQGFSNWPDLQGSYHLSSTWFDVFLQFRSEEKQPVVQCKLQCNVHAGQDWKVHENTWYADQGDIVHRDCLYRLQPGDLLRVYARAQYAAWVNHVRKVEVEMFGKSLQSETMTRV